MTACFFIVEMVNTALKDFPKKHQKSKNILFFIYKYIILFKEFVNLFTDNEAVKLFENRDWTDKARKIFRFSVI